MIAVLGMSSDELIELLKLNSNDGGVCEIANDNANGQIILSGNKKVETFESILKEKKIKTIPLKVSALSIAL